MLLFGGFFTNSWAATLSFDPDPQNVVLGDAYEVNLRISGLGVGTAPSLGAYDLDITFDPVVFDFVNVVFGDPVLGNQLDQDGFGAPNGANIISPGELNIFEVSFDSIATLNNLQADEFILAVLRFDTLAEGSSVLGIGVSGLGDAVGTALPFDIVPGSVTVDPQVTIPEPGTGLLLILGFLGIGFRVLRKSA